MVAQHDHGRCVRFLFGFNKWTTDEERPPKNLKERPGDVLATDTFRPSLAVVVLDPTGLFFIAPRSHSFRIAGLAIWPHRAGLPCSVFRIPFPIILSAQLSD
jgi:hypothetical protein